MHTTSVPSGGPVRLMMIVSESVRPIFASSFPSRSVVPARFGTEVLYSVALGSPCINFYARARRPGVSPSAQGWRHHWGIALGSRHDVPQPRHQPLEHALLLVVIAVVHSGATGVPPDLSRHEQEAQSRGSQGRVAQFGGVGLRLAIEQQATRSILARPYWWLPSFEAFARKQWYPPLSPDKPRRSAMPVVGSSSGCRPAWLTENDCHSHRNGLTDAPSARHRYSPL